MDFHDLILIGQNAAPPSPMSGLSFLFPLVLVGVFYYLIVYKPEAKARAEHADLLKNLKKNDHVVTAGGIHGTVVQASSDSTEIVIRIDENTNTKIHIQRSSIARVVTDENEKDKAA